MQTYSQRCFFAIVNTLVVACAGFSIFGNVPCIAKVRGEFQNPEAAIQQPAPSEDTAVDTESIISKVAGNLASKQKYLLQHRLKTGSEYRWSVEHVTSTKTKAGSDTEETWTRTLCMRCYKVVDFAPNQESTFDVSMESFSTWKKINEQSPVTFDSKEPNSKVPFEFQGIGDRIGVVLSTYRVKPSGQVVSRSSETKAVDLSLGDVLVPFPEEAIPVGYKWFVPRNCAVTNEFGRPEQIPLRTKYEFEKIVDQKAYISVQTQVLTPIESEKVKMELMQKMSSGYIAFDMVLGIVDHEEYECNEKVQGYPSPDALLHYSYKVTSKLVKDNDKTATKVQPQQETLTALIKPIDGKPVLRKE